jgi:serine protease Do
MNKLIITALMPWLFAAIGYRATAQDVEKKKDGPKEVQEIIIKKKGGKDATYKIEFKDDKVFINGKSLVEFKDDEVTINNKTYKYKQLEKDMEGFGRDMERFGQEMELAFGGDNFKGKIAPFMSGTFLGVSTENDEKGAKIVSVTKGSAAEKAGLLKGDIITKVGDTKIDGPGDLSEVISAKKPKEEVKISFKRDGKDKSVKATLQERKEVRSFSFSTPDGGTKAFTLPRSPRTPGARVMPPGNLYNEDFNYNYGDNFVFGRQQKLGLKIQDLEEGSGVKVLEVEEGSAAEKAGIKKDDIITEVGGVKVNNTDEAREQLHVNSEKSTYPITAKRNNAEMKFEVKIPKKLKTTNL